jgi:hypothetical protein
MSVAEQGTFTAKQVGVGRSPPLQGKANCEKG